MELNYTAPKGVSIESFESCDSFQVGDSIVCLNDSEAFNITKNKKYEALCIYESVNLKEDKPHKTKVVMIADDGDEICSYGVDRFISIDKHRRRKLSKILN